MPTQNAGGHHATRRSRPVCAGHQRQSGRAAEADGHLAALLEVVRRHASEPIMLEDVEVEVVTTDPLSRLR